MPSYSRGGQDGTTRWPPGLSWLTSSTVIRYWKWPVERVLAILEEQWLLRVRPMEAVLARGPAALEPTCDALYAALDDDERRNVRWPLVLLGEMRLPAAVPALIETIRRPGGDPHITRMIAAEALAKIGPPALMPLRSLVGSDNRDERLWAYAAMAWIPHEDSYRMLTAALEADVALASMVAAALADQGKAEAIPAIYRALERAEPAMRSTFEDAIRLLRDGEALSTLHLQDWRLRYRLDPLHPLGILVPWPAIFSTGSIEGRPETPLRPLEQILAEPRDPPRGELCECCNEEMWTGTGVEVCARSALDLAVDQFRLLGFVLDAHEDYGDDLFELLELAEQILWDQREAESQQGHGGDWGLNEARETQQLVLGACRWSIERGIETVAGARAALAIELGRLATLHGDPDRSLPALDAEERARRSVAGASRSEQERGPSLRLGLELES